jgi:hypothetical protein
LGTAVWTVTFAVTDPPDELTSANGRASPLASGHFIRVKSQARHLLVMGIWVAPSSVADAVAGLMAIRDSAMAAIAAYVNLVIWLHLAPFDVVAQ